MGLELEAVKSKEEAGEVSGSRAWRPEFINFPKESELKSWGEVCILDLCKPML